MGNVSKDLVAAMKVGVKPHEANSAFDLFRLRSSLMADARHRSFSWHSILMATEESMSENS